MTSNNGNSNSDINKERKRQEVSILESFLRVSKKRVEHLRVHQARELNLSEGEMRILDNIHSAGMWEGIIAGVATFVIMRRVPRYLGRMAARRQQQQQQGYTLDSPPSSPFHPNNNNALQQQQQQQGMPNRGGFLWRSFQFTLDATLSLLVAAYTSSYMADTEKIVNSVTGIPLMEGRSAISDHFCGVLVEEYKRQWKMDPQHHDSSNSSSAQEQDSTTSLLSGIQSNQKPLAPFDRKPILKDPQVPALKGYIQFIQNCQQRQAMERRLRQEQGLGPNDPVEIPSPGIVVASEWGNSHHDDSDGLFFDEINNNNNNNKNGNGDFYNDDEAWSKEDASAFASDQEEDARRKK